MGGRCDWSRVSPGGRAGQRGMGEVKLNPEGILRTLAVPEGKSLESFEQGGGMI